MDEINKSALSESDVCRIFISPALVDKAGWNSQTQIREQVTFTKGQIIVKGRLTARGEKKRADYVLYYKPNLPLAVVEAKDNNKSLDAGLQQAIDYAETLDAPFAYSSNGDGFIEHDRTALGGVKERELTLDEFPTPAELWRRYCRSKGIDDEAERIYTQDYYPSPDNKTPRYYQVTAINRTIEAIAKGQQRVLLVMATGTGKTFTAFQIIWRLWKSGAKKRILFLADRNILVDQTRTNDFKPFGSMMTKIENRAVDPAYEIYLGLYQALTGAEDARNVYKQFSPNFFDLIVIDECHRGSAAEDSNWRAILEYFGGATQIGLTATPKETKEVSNIEYFGEPVFTYSLRQGIADGFLAPYKVVRYELDKDLEGWQPTAEEVDKYGKLIENRKFNRRDFDRELVLEKRTALVAAKITEYLKATNRFDKTIVFCEDTEHAGRMRRALINANSDIADSRYVMQITGDNREGVAELDNFILPESRFPVVVTTAELLSTGVDAQTCKLIVLDKQIESMTKFKQIIGRGTRIREDYGKRFFTVMDFRGVTELFRDPAFDGEPVQIYEPQPGDPIVPPDDELPSGADETVAEETEKRKKYYVADVEVSVISERVSYYGKDGTLTTESLKDYTIKNVRKEFASLDEFLRKWSAADKKQAVVEELERAGVLFEALEQEIGGKDIDAFDLICHIAYGQKPLTRGERAANVRKRDYFGKYEGAARQVLEALLEKYADAGVGEIESTKVLQLPPFDRIGRASEIIGIFGGKEKYQAVVRELEAQIYAA